MVPVVPKGQTGGMSKELDTAAVNICSAHQRQGPAVRLVCAHCMDVVNQEAPKMPGKKHDPDGLNRKGVGLGTQRDASEFAQRILTRAAQLGMNKLQLAAKAGLSRQTLANMLQFASGGDNPMPAIRTFLLLGQALRVHPAWLIEGLFTNVVVDTAIDTRMRAGHSPNVADVNFAQGVLAAPGSRFTKTWRVRNDGPQPWAGLKLVCQDRHIVFTSKRTGEALFAADCLKPDALEIALPDLAPGEQAEVSVGYTAPVTSGANVSRWLAVAPGDAPVPGGPFGAWVLVHVTTLADTLAFEPLPS